jgi:ABC-type Fe3+ transport system permease subunit
MSEVINLIIGVVVLALGIPLGNFLAKYTKEELKPGRRWFRWIVILSLIGVIIGLILGNDVLLFSLAFIAIVTSRSLKK